MPKRVSKWKMEVEVWDYGYGASLTYGTFFHTKREVKNISTNVLIEGTKDMKIKFKNLKIRRLK